MSQDDTEDGLPPGIERPETEGLNHAQIMCVAKKVAYLKAFAEYGIITDGCRAAGVSRKTYEYWLESDEWFAKSCRVARELSTDRIEREALRRAVDGYEEPVLFQGQPTIITDKVTGEERYLTVRKYSDGLMSMVLKGRRREVYGDKVEQSHEFKNGGVLVVPGQVLDQSAWEAAASEQQERFVTKKE